MVARHERAQRRLRVLDETCGPRWSRAGFRSASRDGTGRDRLHLVCGFRGCDLRPFNPLRPTLPHVIDFTLDEAREPRAGRVFG